MTSAHRDLDQKQGELERRLGSKSFDERVAELQGLVEEELARPPEGHPFVGALVLTLAGMVGGLALLSWVIAS
jgi:hypothetical protein